MSEQRPGFHVAPIAKSPAQQRILAYLRQCGSIGATTRDICLTCDVQAVSTWISSLRHNGIELVRRSMGKSETGMRVHRYWLKEFFPVEQEEEAA